MYIPNQLPVIESLPDIMILQYDHDLGIKGPCHIFVNMVDSSCNHHLNLTSPPT